MIALVCLRHPLYKGAESPDLKCKACCAIFVQRVKLRSEQQSQDIATWLDNKSAKEAITWNI